MEEALGEGKGESHKKSEKKRKRDLEKRFNNDGDHVNDARKQCLCNAEGNSEQDKTDSIVERDDGEQHIGDGAFRLILTNDHQGGGGSSRGGYGSEYDRRGQRKDGGEDEMKKDERAVYHEGSNDCLEDADHGCLLADLLQLSKTEFVADREGDEAEGDVGDDAVIFDVGVADEAESLDAECTERVGADEDACHEVGSNGRETEAFCEA